MVQLCLTQLCLMLLHDTKLQVACNFFTQLCCLECHLHPLTYTQVKMVERVHVGACEVITAILLRKACRKYKNRRVQWIRNQSRFGAYHQLLLELHLAGCVATDIFWEWIYQPLTNYWVWLDPWLRTKTPMCDRQYMQGKDLLSHSFFLPQAQTVLESLLTYYITLYWCRRDLLKLTVFVLVSSTDNWKKGFGNMYSHSRCTTKILKGIYCSICRYVSTQFSYFKK